MQDKKVDSFTEITVPNELLEEARINPGKVLQMFADGNRIIIENVDSTDYDCDGNCEDCPFFESECDNDCENCPCTGECENSEEMTLYDFLNSLSEQQQRAALVHLSVKWAEKQGGETDVEE